MTTTGSTAWTVIEGAAAGNRADRGTFARLYLPIVAQYLRKRWLGTPLADQVDDAVQEVFVDCLRANGALSRADRRRQRSFRAFMYGVTKNVARGVEARSARARAQVALEDLELADGRDGEVSEEFDRAWARAVLNEALRLQVENARAASDATAALRRVELLRLRVYEGQPARTIAKLWNVDPAYLHRQYAQARNEFQHALRLTLQEKSGLLDGVTEEDLMELLSKSG